MDTEIKMEYHVKVITEGYSKENIDVARGCYCKSISEVVDVVYFYLSKFDRDKMKEISIIPEKRLFYKKGLTNV